MNLVFTIILQKAIVLIKEMTNEGFNPMSELHFEAANETSKI